MDSASDGDNQDGLFYNTGISPQLWLGQREGKFEPIIGSRDSRPPAAIAQSTDYIETH